MMMAMRAPPSSVLSAWASMCSRNTPRWHVETRTARTLRQRIRSVLEWAVAMEMRVDNPCDRIGPVLGP